MNIVQLRDKLNEMIEQGKGDYIVYDDEYGVVELNRLIEGTVVVNKNTWGFNIKSFIDDEDLCYDYEKGLLKDSIESKKGIRII